MNLFDIFQRSTLPTTWVYRSPDVIWRLLPTGAGLLIGESRNTETRRVSFFCIDTQTGNPCWKDKTFEEPWWIGLEGTYNDVVFIHEYATPELPDHLRVRALDTASGELLWENTEVQFIKAHEGIVYVSKMGLEERIFLGLDVRTGEKKKEFSFEEVFLVEAESEKMPDSIVFPSVLDIKNINSNMLENVPVKYLQSSIYTEYINQNGRLVVAYFQPDRNEKGNEPKLEQALNVFDPAGKLLYKDLISTGVNYPTPDSFLCIGDLLCYVKNKNELIAVKL